MACTCLKDKSTRQPNVWDPNCPAHPKGLDGKTGGSILEKWVSGDTGFADFKVGGPGHSTHKPYVGKTCVHDGTKVSFHIERANVRRGQSKTVAIYGARGSSLMKPGADLTHLDLLIDMSGTVKRPKNFAKPGSWKVAALNKVVFPEVLSLDWPDMTAPTWVPARFWVNLLAALPPAVCISCMGSHGRTGTAMACLLVANGMSPDRAIGVVRQEHCSHAIETAAQEAYIHAVAKRLGR